MNGNVNTTYRAYLTARAAYYREEQDANTYARGIDRASYAGRIIRENIERLRIAADAAYDTYDAAVIEARAEYAALCAAESAW